jgi:hypothetical protein
MIGFRHHFFLRSRRMPSIALLVVVTGGCSATPAPAPATIQLRVLSSNGV